ncbi:DUF1254 domain-containing protein [Luteolibacter arcticus]|uniref:DUF1254 domain-containing protein n=1 Tax=Luteolibacter arcticus TaxID=1581411 RepID=A0ABT3GK91_9BACT|nr:DUF1254 domain-containing protein [Luteolibacter arcticus]MCW1923900.1 DUF1254 domain-containing protein [Luteolibacter arcticus]
MKTTTLFLALTLGPSSVWAQKTPGYNHKIPEQIMTPDTVETRIGTLKFFDGLPSKDTTRRVYDNLDFMRGVEAFLNFVPAASIEGIRRGMVEQGATKPNQCLMFEELLDSSPLLLTGNTDTVYASVILDLEKDGPTVVEIPPGCGPGTVNDAYFRFVVDMGAPGPDRGKGGKYLILPPGYKGEVPSGYHEARSPSYVNWLILRGFLVDGKPDAAARNFREGLKVYPLSQAGSPPAMEFINGSRKAFNTVHANNFEFYEELAHVIAREPIEFIDPELRGLASSIGIRKDKPFKPDARMKTILTEAVAVGNATARALIFETRDREAYYYENSRWKAAFVGGDYQWLSEGGVGGRNLDARTLFFYQATVNTPAMVLKIPGVGSQYAYTEQDTEGSYLDGSKHYRLNIPANVPAKDFWSVVLYDPQTRSELQTSQTFPSKNNKRDQLVANADGSVELNFGPTAPAGKESNWIQTVPHKGWYTILRLYGPLEPWFEKTWRPGEIEPVK